jgi:hypothetical protein
MKSDNRIEELEAQVIELQRRVDQILTKNEIWGDRLAGVENYVVRKRYEEKKSGK